MKASRHILLAHVPFLFVYTQIGDLIEYFHVHVCFDLCSDKIKMTKFFSVIIQYQILLSVFSEQFIGCSGQVCEIIGICKVK